MSVMSRPVEKFLILEEGGLQLGFGVRRRGSAYHTETQGHELVEKGTPHALGRRVRLARGCVRRVANDTRGLAGRTAHFLDDRRKLLFGLGARRGEHGERGEEPRGDAPDVARELDGRE
jgi:hypothetical protein